MDIDIKDKALIKEALSGAEKGSTKRSFKRLRKASDQIKAVQEARPFLKDIVEDFCKEGITIYLSYKSDRVVTVGSEANSILTRLVTGTKGIEINNPLKLAEIAI